MNNSGSTALLGVIVGVVIVAGVIFFWANGTFTGGNNKSVNITVPVPNVTITTPPAIVITPAKP